LSLFRNKNKIFRSEFPLAALLEKKKSEERIERERDDMFGGRQHFVENLEGQTRTIARECEARLLYFRNCTECKFEVVGTPIKVVIDNCTNVHLMLSCGNVLTGTLEVVRCKQLMVGLQQETSIVPTLTIDMCNDVQLVVKHRSAIRNVISASDCSNIRVVTLSATDGTLTEVQPVVPPADIRSQQLISKADEGGASSQADDTQTPIQFISRFSNNNTLVTEVVVREGCGYPTTLREKKIADEKERQLSERLEKIVSESISSSQGLQRSPSMTSVVEAPASINSTTSVKITLEYNEVLVRNDLKLKVQMFEPPKFRPGDKQAVTYLKVPISSPFLFLLSLLSLTLFDF